MSVRKNVSRVSGIDSPTVCNKKTQDFLGLFVFVLFFLVFLSCCSKPQEITATQGSNKNVQINFVIEESIERVHNAENNAWNLSAINVRVRIEALTIAGMVLRKTVYLMSDDGDPPDLRRFFTPSSNNSLLIQHPSGQASRSIGRPNRGWLVNGIRLPDSPFWLINRSQESFGSAFMINEFMFGLHYIAQTYPETSVVGVFDLSFEHGGPNSPHVSHESGRDVDFAYYLDPLNGSDRRFTEATEENLQVEKQWQLFRLWIERDVLTYLFIDRSLLRLLYNHAHLIGESEGFLRKAFGDPGVFGNGIIRHAAGHHDHIHARFRCAPDNAECLD